MEIQGGTGGARRLGAKRDVSPMTATVVHVSLFCVLSQRVSSHPSHQLIFFLSLSLALVASVVVVGLSFFLFCPRGGGDAARFVPVCFFGRFPEKSRFTGLIAISFMLHDFWSFFH